MHIESPPQYSKMTCLKKELRASLRDGIKPKEYELMGSHYVAVRMLIKSKGRKSSLA